MYQRPESGAGTPAVSHTPGLIEWGDPNARLLGEAAWKAARPRVCEELDLDPDANIALTDWIDRLDRSHRELVAGLAANPAARIEPQHDGRDRIILTGLDRLEVPASLDELNKQIDARLPMVDLPETILEVNSRVPCLSDFTHQSKGDEAPWIAVEQAANVQYRRLMYSSKVQQPGPPAVTVNEPRTTSDLHR